MVGSLFGLYISDSITRVWNNSISSCCCSKVIADYTYHKEQAERVAKEARQEAERVAKEARQTYASVTSTILELKFKIKDFKEKGIKTDELELRLGEVEREMSDEQPPVM